MEELQMRSYYYGFSKTGNTAIDKILCAVARAGKDYHHTANWNVPLNGVDGPSAVEFIQKTADEAAAMLKEGEK